MKLLGRWCARGRCTSGFPKRGRVVAGRDSPHPPCPSPTWGYSVLPNSAARPASSSRTYPVRSRRSASRPPEHQGQTSSEGEDAATDPEWQPVTGTGRCQEWRSGWCLRQLRSDRDRNHGGGLVRCPAQATVQHCPIRAGEGLDPVVGAHCLEDHLSGAILAWPAHCGGGGGEHQLVGGAGRRVAVLPVGLEHQRCPGRDGTSYGGDIVRRLTQDHLGNRARCHREGFWLVGDDGRLTGRPARAFDDRLAAGVVEGFDPVHVARGADGGGPGMVDPGLGRGSRH